MTKENILSFVSNCPLFKGVSGESLDIITSGDNIKTFNKKDDISFENSANPCLYCIIEGKIKVYGMAREKTVILNILEAGDIFGAATVLGDCGNISSITADKDCVLLCLPKRTVEKLIELDCVFSKNYIMFLSDRIKFLNRRISSFTAGSADKKLADWLISKKGKEDFIILPYTNIKLASVLNMGRASLYRAFDFLVDSGYIERDGNKIYFKSFDEFKKIYGGKL